MSRIVKAASLLLCLSLCSCASPEAPDTGPAAEGEVVRYGYSVQGPWDIGEPVHEVLMLVTIRSAIEDHGAAGELLKDVKPADLPAWESRTAHVETHATLVAQPLQQFLRGVIWPDDPEGLFFMDRKDATRFSTGFQWNVRFNDKSSNPANLTARSHFGDLQYFHSMSPTSSMPAAEVRRRMLEWAGFLLDVASGAVGPETSLGTIPAAAGLKGRSTVRKLFVADTSATALHVRQRAVGALLHLIQDSHSPGHAKRDADGTIVAFHCYSDPDHDRATHALADTWGPGATLRDRIANTPRAADAVKTGRHIVTMLSRRAPKADILAYLESRVFPLSTSP